VSFAPDGTRRWAHDFAAPGATSARATALACASGPIVAGWSTSAGGSDDGFVARYTAGGTPLWSHTGSGTLGLAVCPVDGSFAFTSGTGSLTAASITAAGEQAWERSVSPAGYDDFRPVAVRASGSAYLYAAGSAAVDGGGHASVLVRYRP